MDKNKTYFVSDIHFGHKNIMKYEPEYRNYSSVEEMDESIITQWNETISKEDTVYNLGDFFFTSNKERIREIVKRLNYKKMVLIIGNHDSSKVVKQLSSEFNIECKYADRIKVEGIQFFLSHYPMYMDRKGLINLHGHIHSKDMRDSKNNKSLKHINIGLDNMGKVAISLEDVVKQAKENISQTKQTKPL